MHAKDVEALELDDVEPMSSLPIKHSQCEKDIPNPMLKPSRFLLPKHQK